MIFPTQALAVALAAAASALAAAPAFAHHAMGGDMPGNAFEGFVSGLAHPVIGIDHLAFIVAIGVIAAFTGVRRAGPAVFVAATLGGCLAAVAALALSYGELAVALSVVL
ncbi:MAG: HupE/UreJ family protein, partial [Alphaproteobacteria bacterium]